MKVYYAHGGGYTELGGMKHFLSKINSNLRFERIFPAIAKKPKPNRKFTQTKNTSKAKINPSDAGVSGTDLFKKILDRLKKKSQDGETISILIIIDDTDCKLSNETAKSHFLKAVENFKRHVTEIFSDISIIFLWIEPEIEKWFCIDINNCFPNTKGNSHYKNKSCGKEDLHRKLIKLLESYDFNYDFEKKSCKEKFSEKFKAILEECGISYSKRNDGFLLLSKVDPAIIEEKDKFAAPGIREIRNIE